MRQLHPGPELTDTRRTGNSEGALIPMRLLQQIGVEDQAEMEVEGNSGMRASAGHRLASHRLGGYQFDSS